jgi:hypothetical protein
MNLEDIVLGEVSQKQKEKTPYNSTHLRLLEIENRIDGGCRGVGDNDILKN